MAIVDAHHHFWDLARNRYPWLQDDPPAPFRYGDYSAIRRDYLPADFRRDSDGFALAGSVHVEAEWNPDDPVGETRWLAQIRAAHGLPSACVAQAWLHHDDAAAVLAAQAQFPFVRGIRHKPPPGAMEDTAWRAGYALLERYGLSFDLQTPWPRLAEAAALARDFPATTIILNHTGLPADRSRDGLASWRAAMRGFASAANTAVKISGLGVAGAAWSAAANRGVVLDTIDIFGVERCLFASNFPVDSIVAGYRTIFEGFGAITADFTQAERDALFRGNAGRYYRLDLETGGRGL